MAADVQQRVQLAVAVARDDDRDVADAAREEVARLRSVLDGAGVLPAVPEDPLLLPPQQLGVGVPAPRQRALRSPGGQTGHDYTRGPMDFELSADQREIQALAREFAQAEIEPNAADWDREHGFPRELFGKLAELGFGRAASREAYGGAGADFLSYILVLEELSRADAGVGVTVAVHTSAVTLPILSSAATSSAAASSRRSRAARRSVRSR